MEKALKNFQKKLELSSTPPYEYMFENNEYNFTAENGIEYVVYFSDLSSALFRPEFNFVADLILDFGFHPKHLSFEEIKLKGSDKRIKSTILKILANYFLQNENIVIYSCEASDNRQLVRHRLFNKWFNEFRELGFVKFDAIIKIDEDTAYPYNLICRSDNYHLKAVEHAFEITKLYYQK